MHWRNGQCVDYISAGERFGEGGEAQIVYKFRKKTFAYP